MKDWLFTHSKALFSAALFLFGVSLFTPAISTRYGSATKGLNLFLMGPLGIFMLGEVRWLANPFFLIPTISGLLFKRQRAWALWSSFCGVLLTLSCFIFPIKHIRGDSGSPYIYHATLEIGAYLWIFASMLAFTGCIINRGIRKTLNSDSKISDT